MGKLLNDENFKHVHYNVTNVAKTFARVRKEQAEAEAKRKAEAEAISVEAAIKVHVLKGAAK